MWGGVCVGVRVFACLRVCVFVYSLPDASPVLSPAANSALFLESGHIRTAQKPSSEK